MITEEMCDALSRMFDSWINGETPELQDYEDMELIELILNQLKKIDFEDCK